MEKCGLERLWILTFFSHWDISDHDFFPDNERTGFITWKAKKFAHLVFNDFPRPRIFSFIFKLY